LQSLSEALNALRVVKTFQAQSVQEKKTQTWIFVVTGDKTCEECQKYKDDTYELEDADDLLSMFFHGEWIDEDTFAPNIHLNCECTIIRSDENE